ncbi:DUF4394 domain-containing protein [Mesorhizobium sp. CAU 1741]|uniref:DUF4394 domain-containing protein n=1 Tax=Mesorhizobium sp. CAU 1741 TaxID=3140366 RepID=UPI00325C1593
MNTTKLIALAATLGASTAIAAPAFAANVVALAGDRDLVWVDSEAMATTGMKTVEGAEGRLLGIDVRPADGMLYGVFEDGTIATIDPESGMATGVSTLATMLPDGVTATVDFNPVADRLRLMGNDGTNLRVNVDTGEVTEDGSHAFGEQDQTPDIIAGAYTNSYAGTEATQLFNIDSSAWLVLQNPPNDGVLVPVGEIGMDVEQVGFDILSDGQGGNEAWLMSGGTLYAVDLESGAATEAGAVEGADAAVRDIAIMPAM